MWAVFVIEFLFILSLAPRVQLRRLSTATDFAVVVLSFPLLPNLLALVRLARIVRLLRLTRLTAVAVLGGRGAEGDSRKAWPGLRRGDHDVADPGGRRLPVDP